MRKNPLLPLALPLTLLMGVSSCKKDLNVINGSLNTSQGPRQDRGFIVIAREGAKLESISASLFQLGVKDFRLKEAIKEIGLIHVQTPDPSFPEKARQIA